MDKLELLKVGLGFIEKIVASLAWPLVVLVIAVMFKEKFTRLLDEISEWKGWGVEAKFARGVKEALKQAEEVTGQPPPQQPAVDDVNQAPLDLPEPGPIQTPEPTLPELPDLSAERPLSKVNMLLIHANPGAAIQLAWADVQNELLDVIKHRGVYVKPDLTGDVNAWINAIDKVGLLTAEQLSLLLRLRDLRNEVVQARVSPSGGTAKDYVDASILIARQLRKIAKQR